MQFVRKTDVAAAEAVTTARVHVCLSPSVGFFISRIPISVLFSFRGLTELLTSVPLLASRFIPHGQYIYDKPIDALKYKQIYLIGNIMILLYNGMAAFQYSEAIFGKRQCSVLDSLRIVMILLILVTVAVIPSLVSDFLETMHKRDVIGGHVIRDAHPFILIVGTFTVEQATETLDGFLNVESTDGKLSVVFLDTKPLSDELKLLGRNSVWGHRVHFLHSLCLDEKALQRAQAQHARAIFTISDCNAPDPVKEDERNTVRLWTLHCYTARHNVPIYTYNLSPSTAIYQKVAKEVICVRQFNQYLLALNCRCRGASTLLTNLLHQRDPLNQYDAPWEAQYETFFSLDVHYQLLYRELQIILFAVRVQGDQVILNPCSANNHIIQETDTCIYIAQSSKDIRDIESLERNGSATDSARQGSARDTEFRVSRLPTSSLSLLIGIGSGIGPSASPLTCYLLCEPAKLEDVIIHTTAGIRGHILVCMHQEFTNLFKFLYNLRSSHLRPEELQDIVLLCAELPSKKIFHPISLFPRGNCRQPDDLIRAGVKRAKQVVVMRYVKRSWKKQCPT
ncbi:hypothetical protein BX666DRAFT_1863740 [Dichotomocladium elegans]|nr:hypothetical protein BX666DRAFT_1863740 [Dichotomocladium elegans]